MNQSENVIAKHDRSLEKMQLERFVVAIEGIERSNTEVVKVMSNTRADFGAFRQTTETFRNRLLDALAKINESLQTIDNHSIDVRNAIESVDYGIGELEAILGHKVNETDTEIEAARSPLVEPQKKLITCRKCLEELGENEFIGDSGVCFSCQCEDIAPKIQSLLSIAPSSPASIGKALGVMDVMYSPEVIAMVLENMQLRDLVEIDDKSKFSLCKTSPTQQSAMDTKMESFFIRRDTVAAKFDKDVLNLLPAKDEAERLASLPYCPQRGTAPAIATELIATSDLVRCSLKRLEDNDIIGRIAISKRNEKTGGVVKVIYYRK